MATTKRGNILEYIRSTIEGLSSIKKAETKSVRALHELDKSLMPFVNITSSGEYDKDSSGVGSSRQAWSLSVAIEMLTLDNNAEDRRGEIKVALEADRTCGGHAENVVYESDTDDISFDIPAGAQTTTMIFKVQYIVSEGEKI